MNNKRVLSKIDLGSFIKPNPYKKDIIYDPRGQWDHPGENTRIPGGDITMKGVDYPVWAQPSVGPGTMMQPGQDYNFPGAEYVDEYPQMRKGGSKKKSSKYTRNILATNKLLAEGSLFKKGPLFKKPKKNQIFDPNASFYQDGGAFEAELDNDEIDQYRKDGYIVEELDDYDEGGEACPEGFEKDPVTGDCIALPERTQDVQEVITNQYSPYIAKYKSANPRDAYVYQKKAEYLNKHKGLNKLAGLSQDNFPQKVEGNYNKNWEYDKNSAVIAQYAKDHGINPKDHVELVEKIADKGPVSYDMIAHSKYGSKLQPSLWAKSLAGAQELGNFIVKQLPGTQGDVFNKQIKGLTKKEYDEIHNSGTGALETLAVTDLPGAIIANSLADLSTASGGNYQESPGLLSGELKSNVDPTKAALLNPLLYMGIGEGLASAPKIAEGVLNMSKGAKNLVKGVANYGDDIIKTSKQAGKFELPKYSNTYRVEHAGFNTPSSVDDLTGRWFANNPKEVQFYASKLKDPKTGEIIPLGQESPVRIMRERLPEYKIKENFGAGMPEEARTMSMGRGDFTDAGLDELLGPGAGDRFTMGKYTNSDLNAMESAPFLFRQEEGILDANRVNQLRSGINQGIFSRGNTATLNNQFDAINYLSNQQKIIDNQSRIKQFLPFKDGGEYFEMDLTPEEIDEYKKGGFIVEDISVPTLNQAQDGGEDPVPLDPHQAFLKNWYENRVFPKEMQKAKPILLEQLSKPFPPYVPTDRLPADAVAAYNSNNNTVEVNQNYPAEVIEGSKTHEDNHWLTEDANEYLDKPHSHLIEQNIIDPKDINTGSDEWNKLYEENFDYIVAPEEMHSRIMTFRELAGFKPNQVITEKDVEDYFKKAGDKLDPDIQDVKQVTKGTKSIVELLNYMVSNDRPGQDNDIQYSKNGGQLFKRRTLKRMQDGDEVNSINLVSPNATVWDVAQPQIGVPPITPPVQPVTPVTPIQQPVVEGAPKVEVPKTQVSVTNDPIPVNNNVFEIQKKLKAAGYDLGNFGPNGDGIDGQMGNRTKLALDAYNANIPPSDVKPPNPKAKLKGQTNNYSVNHNLKDGYLPYLGKGEETCVKGQGCSANVSIKMGNLLGNITDKNLWANDAWFNKSDVLKQGGDLVYENNEKDYSKMQKVPKDVWSKLQVGDYVQLNRTDTGSSLNFAAQTREGLENEGIEHLGFIVGKDKDGTPLVWHGSVTGKAYVQRIDQPISLPDENKLSNSNTFTYQVSSIVRSPALKNADFSGLQNSAYYTPLDPKKKLVPKKGATESQVEAVTALNNSANQFKNLGYSQDDANYVGRLLIGGIMSMETKGNTDWKADAKQTAAYLVKDVAGINAFDIPIINKRFPGKEFEGDEASVGAYQMKPNLNFRNKDGSLNSLGKKLEKLGLSVEDITSNNIDAQTKAGTLILLDNYEKLKKDPNFNIKTGLYKGKIPASYILAKSWQAGQDWYTRDKYKKFLDDFDVDYSNGALERAIHTIDSPYSNRSMANEYNKVSQYQAQRKKEIAAYKKEKAKQDYLKKLSEKNKQEEAFRKANPNYAYERRVPSESTNVYNPYKDPYKSFDLTDLTKKKGMGSTVYKYAQRPGVKYKKDANGNWYINSGKSSDNKYVALKDPSGERTKALNKGAKPFYAKEGGIVTSLSQAEIDRYIKDGYVVEQLD